MAGPIEATVNSVNVVVTSENSHGVTSCLMNQNMKLYILAIANNYMLLCSVSFKQMVFFVAFHPIYRQLGQS